MMNQLLEAAVGACPGKMASRDKSRQAEFSRRYALSSRSLQEWEQGHRRPESAVRACLTVIDRNPEAVEKALTNKS
jgi:DNA-binding transcriptional regulator YiaG